MAMLRYALVVTCSQSLSALLISISTTVFLESFQIWFVRELEDGTVNVECVADLKRHNRAVNIVRFSPDGKFLATADDGKCFHTCAYFKNDVLMLNFFFSFSESALFIWKKPERFEEEFFEPETGDEQINKDKWVVSKTLRGHLEDIQDLCWSRNSNFLVSGSVDNTAIIWDITKGQQVSMLSDPKGFVQGVAFDPRGQLVAVLSTDR